MAILHISNGMDNDNTRELPSKGYKRTVSKDEEPRSTNLGSEGNFLDPMHGSGSNGTSCTPIIPDTPDLYNHIGVSVSNYRFIKFIPCHESQWLQKNYPNAFLLLCLIAQRARRFNGHIDGLEIGMATIGDYKEAGIESQKKYRTAKEVLVKHGFIRVVKTRHKKFDGANGGRSTGEKTAIEMANERANENDINGTLVIILTASIWDINPEVQGDRNGERKGERRAIDRHKKGDEQEERGKKEEEEKISKIAVATAPSVSKSRSSSSKRKIKEPEPKIQRDIGVFTSETAHKKLIESKGGEEVLKKIYSEIAVWKADSGVVDGNDFSLANKWTLKCKNTSKKPYGKVQPKLNQDERQKDASKIPGFLQDT